MKLRGFYNQLRAWFSHEKINSLGVIFAVTLGSVSIGFTCSSQRRADDRYAKDEKRRVQEGKRESAETIDEAIATYWKDRSDEAIFRVMRLRKEFPDEASLKVTEGAIRLDEGDFEESAELLGAVLEVNPNNVAALAYSGILWLKWVDRRDEARAVELLRLAREHLKGSDGGTRPRLFLLADDKEYILYALGLGLVELNEMQEAEQVLVEADSLQLEDEERNPEVRKLLGIVYWHSDRGAEAIDQFRGALELQPDNTEYQRMLIGALGRVGELEAEIKRLEGLIEENPSELKDPRVGGLLFEALVYLGRDEASLSLLRKRREAQ